MFACRRPGRTGCTGRPEERALSPQARYDSGDMATSALQAKARRTMTPRVRRKSAAPTRREIFAFLQKRVQRPMRAAAYGSAALPAAIFHVIQRITPSRAVAGKRAQTRAMRVPEHKAQNARSGDASLLPRRIRCCKMAERRCGRRVCKRRHDVERARSSVRCARARDGAADDRCRVMQQDGCVPRKSNTTIRYAAMLRHEWP